MLPDFDENGNLPPGTHHATIEEVIERFNRPRYGIRGERSRNLSDFFGFVSQFATGIYIDGSFITEKLAPSDVDIFVLLPSDFDTASNYGWRLDRYRKDSKHHRLEIAYAPPALQEQHLARYIATWTHDRDNHEKGIIYVEIHP